MYSIKNTIQSKKDSALTLENLLKRVSEYDIYAHYMGEFKLGNVYNSPIRKDKNPSFSVFVSRKSGKLLYRDFATGDSGDVINFVSAITGVTNFNDILIRISEDLQLKTKKYAKRTMNYTSEKNTNIGVVRQVFTEKDKKYWKQYNISMATLNKYNVSSIKYYLCNGEVKGIYSEDNPMFAYKVYDKFKIYRPLANKYAKWRTNLSDADIQGYEQLPKTGDLLIITKSLKDVMVLYEMGISAIAASSESTFIPDIALEALSKRFKTILVCYDRDVPGVQSVRKIKRKTGLNSFLVHKKFKAKDISDAVAINSFDTVKNWLLNYLNIKT